MKKLLLFLGITSLFVSCAVAQKGKYSDKKIESFKKEASDKIGQKAKMAQVMVDKVFSFAELGFQEEETSKYLTDILKENGLSAVYYSMKKLYLQIFISV